MSREATADILRSSQASIDALLERGGRVFVLEGEEFEQRRRQERDKVYPAFERLLSPGVLAEAQAYAARSER